MHGRPASHWTVEDLAAACALSRTAFAVRFRAAAGIAPLAYLARWRMRLAERALRDGHEGVAAVAHAVGYSSESAFTHAFKRLVGTSPRQYRNAADLAEAAE
jgi:AraC-like DNA-binding protein